MIDWGRVRHFTPDEFPCDPDRMDDRVIYMIDGMRHEEDEHRRKVCKTGIIITINEAWAPRLNNLHSQHPFGRAIDCVIRDAITKKPLGVLEQFLIASRFLWTGIGFYPFWNDPGIHVDLRPLSLYQRRATWWRDEDETYRSVDQYFERRFGKLWLS